MKKVKFLLIIIFFIFFNNIAYSQDEVFFVDMQKILNSSKAGKQAQDFLKKKIVDENKKFEKEMQQLKKDEQDLISKRKTISQDDYKKSLNKLREKNVNYQKRKRDMNNQILGKKNEARNKLLASLNPILKKYMSDNKVKIILDKKYVVMANSQVDITDEILKILNDQVKSINLK